ncbi:SH3 domain-containing protein [Sulfurimonas sp.]
MRYIYTVFFIFFISACSFNTTPQVEKVSDLTEISQNAHKYSGGIDKGNIGTLESFKEQYFRVWNINKIDAPLKEAMWAYNLFTPKNSYGENLQKIHQDFFDRMLKNSNFKQYATINKRALTLHHLNIRAFPTNRPLLKNPKLAGEGFPFDYLQNSTIEANKPILVSHYSKDKVWVFIESSFADGWVKSQDIVYLEKKDTDMWQKAEQTFLTKDNIPIYDENGFFLFKSHIGMMLPLVENNETNNIVVGVNKYQKNQPYYNRADLSLKISHDGILRFNSLNIDNIIHELQKVNYGWGGIYSQRDCSSTMRDFFIPFGIWLPRNSYKQSQIGEVISLENMSNAEKIKTIKKYGVAFETLLYKQGHIVLYVGTVNDKIIIFQNMWGVKTIKNHKVGRFIIGKTIFSTLEVGKNLQYYDEDTSLLKNLKSMNIVTY